ncbi:LysR family transcriptional regulator [Lactobacillus sp. PV034]|uniref:LysR family transcriptional regulator n=1 Tax=Lactobacillus sp. PV034 TaxID=2594495 RepID=UPI00223FB3F5|nr:LysR family transcriptional regulator [Lactobacillus sp. PV034]QNQ80292.1 LysR family transcriptional regulator [Lactobacillus sp. PV034]
MISPELLEELVTFKKYGTLSATAEHLLITQPSVTRGMKKLEQELGVTLFERQANKITLNKTGELAAKEAKKLLDSQKEFTEKVINFANSQNMLHIASTLPGPLLLVKTFDPKFDQDLVINSQLINPLNVTADLLTYKEKIIFTTKEYQTPELESLYLGKENLFVKIDKFNPLAQKNSVTFKDLEGLSFLVAQDIGEWKDISEKYIPNAKFLYQNDLNSLDELTKYSNFPVFRSNLSVLDTNHNQDDNRTLVKIEDEHNELEIYATYLKQNKTELKDYLLKLSQLWPQK